MFLYLLFTKTKKTISQGFPKNFFIQFIHFQYIIATFKTIVKYKKSDGFHNVYIRVTHNSRLTYLKNGMVVDERGVAMDGSVKDPYVLKICSARISSYVDSLNRVDARNWNIKDVVKYITKGSADVSFSDYARKYHDELYNKGQERNARNYRLACQHLERFAGSNRVMFSQLTAHFINAWIKSLMNTSRAKEMYPTCIRMIFEQALVEFNDYDMGIIKIKTNQWPKVTLPKSDTPEKRAITMEACREFFFTELPPTDRICSLPELARDVAMMILCLAGINTIDIFQLKKKDYYNGVIHYNRAKTMKARTDKAYMEMKVPDIILPLFDKYLDRDVSSEFLFNFHGKYSSSDSFNANVNIGIRNICRNSLGLDKGQCYSVYTFRHTWATVAQNECGASLSDVGFALNHSSKTNLTRAYVKINFSPAWTLNEKVIEKIFFTEEKSNANLDITNNNNFEKFSPKNLVKGTLFFRGKTIYTVEDIGFNNVDEIIGELMKHLPHDIPKRCLVQIRIENKDKKQKKDYMRMA